MVKDWATQMVERGGSIYRTEVQWYRHSTRSKSKSHLALSDCWQWGKETKLFFFLKGNLKRRDGRRTGKKRRKNRIIDELKERTKNKRNGERLPSTKRRCTLIQDTFKIGQKYSSAPRAQERASERASERVSAAERASKASSAKQAIEWAVRANERADECADEASGPLLTSRF